VNLRFHQIELKLAHRWAIASSTGSGRHDVIITELTDGQGVTGLGEAAPASTYKESPAGVMAFCEKVDASRLSFGDIPGSMSYLETVSAGETAAKCAFNLALLDGAARLAGKPVCDFLGLGFREGQHVTSFSIGLDNPEVIRQKVLAAAKYPVLKLKVGDPRDKENLAALRSVAPDKAVRVDANEGWKTRDQALRMIEWVASDGRIQFIEQPMPRNAKPADLVWLKERSPLPIFADESYHSAADIAHCAECFHGVNVKLVKSRGITTAHEALLAARRAGLKTMIGCMIESSVLISAGAHLAELADYLDLDGNLLITNDPYEGATAETGTMSFAKAAETIGLRVRPRR
jgi:L-Ala-D/L-Glu epimerase